MDPRIEMAAFLINLGLITAQKVREVFSSAGHDDATLDAIMAEVDRRVVRRG